MKRLRLKSRIIATLCLFSLVLSIVFAAIAILTSIASQDYVFNNTVRHVTVQILADYQANKSFAEHLPQELKAYIGLEGMTEEEIVNLQLKTLPDGVYEAYAPIDLHYSITSIPGADKKLYVLLDVHEIEFDFDNISILAVQLGIPILLTSIIGAVIGLFLARHIINPVSRLAQKVSRTSPENLINDLSCGFADDEIGDLAKSIESTMHRLARFISREQEFTRNVSHELRTPLAVIKNGSELLRSTEIASDRRIIHPLDRIDRAVAEMEQLVATFLFLAREKDISARSQSCDLVEKINDLLVRYDFLLDKRKTACRVLESGRPVVNVAPEILDVILGNCVRNAFQYAAEGDIVVEIDQARITITNCMEKEITASGGCLPGAGIGQSIASRLCERLDWTFGFHVSDGKAVAVIGYAVC